MRKMLWAGLALLTCACASTKITSSVNPSVRQYRPVEKVMVFTPNVDLEGQKVLEARFVEASTDDTQFVGANDIFFAGGNYTKDEIFDGLMDAGIDAVLVVTLTDQGSNQGQWPSSEQTSCSGWMSSGGSSQCYQTSTTKTGGGNYKKPWAMFDARLIDPESKEVLWYASARTGGNAFANAHDLLRSLADKAVSQLKDDGLIDP